MLPEATSIRFACTATGGPHNECRKSIQASRSRCAAYAFALAISASPVTSRQHFPSDVLVGGTFGYLIGGYVVSILTSLGIHVTSVTARIFAVSAKRLVQD